MAHGILGVLGVIGVRFDWRLYARLMFRCEGGRCLDSTALVVVVQWTFLKFEILP